MNSIVLIFAIFSLLTAGGISEARGEEELLVSGAASLTNAFQEVGGAFEKANPGKKILFNFAASGALLQQIDMGAPVDVFASADEKTMDQAEEKGLLLPGTRKNFAGNELVLIVPRDKKIPIGSIKDLRLSDVQRISLGNPESVPAGRYARKALTNEGLWEPLAPKFIYGNSVRQVLDYVTRGEVDAGLVFSTDAAVSRDKVEVVLKAEKHEPIRYPIAAIARTEKKELAQRFTDFVLSEAGQEILSRHGFGKP